MGLLRLELKLPEDYWLSGLSRSNPDELFWVLNFVPAEPHAIALAHIWVGSRAIPQARRWFARPPSGIRSEELYRTPAGALWGVRYRPTVLAELVSEGEVLPRVPFAVRSGWAYWEILGSHATLRRTAGLVLRELPGSRVLSVAPSLAESSLEGLTPEQERVYLEAMRLGYYAHPRRASLTELAEALGQSKGSLSVMLRRIESRLAIGWLRARELPMLWVPPPTGGVPLNGGRENIHA